MEQYKLNWIRRHLDPDSMAKYQHMQEKKRKRCTRRVILATHGSGEIDQFQSGDFNH